jgi:hypothetical protein
MVETTTNKKAANNRTVIADIKTATTYSQQTSEGAPKTPANFQGSSLDPPG